VDKLRLQEPIQRSPITPSEIQSPKIPTDHGPSASSLCATSLDFAEQQAQLRATDWKRAQEKDPTLAKAIALAKDETKETPYLIRGGVLYLKGRIMVPVAMREMVMFLLHNAPAAGHPGRDAMMRQAARRFVWPKMSDDITNWCRRCPCAKAKLRADVKEPSKVFEPFAPFEALVIDYVTDVERSNGKIGMLTIVDRGTKLTKLVAVKGLTAEITAAALRDHWVNSFGAPKVIFSDGDPAFRAKLMEIVCKIWGNAQIFFSPYKKGGPGLVEAFNKKVETIARSLVETRALTGKWPAHLRTIEFAINSAIQPCGMSAIELATGITPRLPCDSLLPWTHETRDWASHQRTLKEYRALFRQWEITKTMERADQIDAKRKLLPQELVKGQSIWYRRHAFKKAGIHPFRAWGAATFISYSDERSCWIATPNQPNRKTAREDVRPRCEERLESWSEIWTKFSEKKSSWLAQDREDLLRKESSAVQDAAQPKTAELSTDLIETTLLKEDEEKEAMHVQTTGSPDDGAVTSLKPNDVVSGPAESEDERRTMGRHRANLHQRVEERKRRNARRNRRTELRLSRSAPKQRLEEVAQPARISPQKDDEKKPDASSS